MVRYTKPEATDDPGYLDWVEATMVGVDVSIDTKQTYVMKIDNWFGKRWLGFSGKALGVLGVRNEKQTLPPFIPSRAFQRLARHFAPLRPQELLATSRLFALRQQADLQAALDELFGERIVPQNFVGIRAQYRHEVTDFAKLLEQSHSAVEVAPAQFEDISFPATRPC